MRGRIRYQTKDELKYYYDFDIIDKQYWIILDPSKPFDYSVINPVDNPEYQYEATTGVKDSQGQEIFENDIIIAPPFDEELLVVVLSRKNHTWLLFNADTKEEIDYFFIIEPSYARVVGKYKGEQII